MQEVNFDEVLDGILYKDGRYHRDAYLFVRDAFDYTQKTVIKSALPTASEGPPERTADGRQHVTGQQLLEGIRVCALDRFGPMAMTVFEEWGVRASEDFGEIVFNFVESSLFSKTKKDSRDHFRGGYDFFEAFRRPFLPSRPRTAPGQEKKPTQV